MDNEALLKLMEAMKQKQQAEAMQLDSELNAPRTDIPYYPARPGRPEDSEQGMYYGENDPRATERLSKFQRLSKLLNSSK